MLSAFFGLLYLFIITPVQYWHQHAEKNAKTNERVYVCQYNADDEYSETSCTVCSHKYSGYQLEIEEPLFAILPLTIVPYFVTNLPVVEGVHTTLCNKGPPALAV